MKTNPIRVEMLRILHCQIPAVPATSLPPAKQVVFVTWRISWAGMEYESSEDTGTFGTLGTLGTFGTLLLESKVAHMIWVLASWRDPESR